VSHSYQVFFGFPRSDLNFDCGLRDDEVHISWYQSWAPKQGHIQDC